MPATIKLSTGYLLERFYHITQYFRFFIFLLALLTKNRILLIIFQGNLEPPWVSCHIKVDQIIYIFIPISTELKLINNAILSKRTWFWGDFFSSPNCILFKNVITHISKFEVPFFISFQEISHVKNVNCILDIKEGGEGEVGERGIKGEGDMQE